MRRAIALLFLGSGFLLLPIVEGCSQKPVTGLTGVSTAPYALVFGAPATGAYHVVCARRSLSAGEQTEVRVEPAPPAGTSIYWRDAIQVGANPSSKDAGRAVYTAPFVIRHGSPPASIRVDFSGRETGRIGFVGRVDLVPSSIAGSNDCLASGQSYSAESGTIEPVATGISRVEEVVVHMSDPEYPPEGARRGLTDTVPLRVLLCASGRVLAAYPLIAYDNDFQPIEHRGVLADAARTIVTARAFAPVMESGMPAAGWIHVQVAFRE